MTAPTAAFFYFMCTAVTQLLGRFLSYDSPD
jgi:hypothetical protein